MLALIFQNASTEIAPTSTKPAGSPPFQSLCTASVNAHSDQAYFGELTEKERLRRDFVLATDYPIKAMRTGVEGTVSLLVLISPEGRIVHSSVIGQADQRMAEVVQVVATRRLRKLHFDGQPCRYVWARLPTVQFRLPPCMNRGKDETPGIPGAIVVTAKCIEVLYDPLVIH
jgi:Gram-negative bacterial TonB protein C-terminal